MKRTPIILALLISTVVFSFGQTEKSVNNINGGMPNRISMNVTVPKQTQGATFGEKVQSGFVDGNCVVLFPNNQAFSVNSAGNKVSLLSSSETLKVNAGLHAAGGALAQGASLPGGALPGGAIISAAVSSVGGGKVIWQVRDAGNELKMPSSLSDGEYELTLNLDAVSKDAAKVHLVFGLIVEKGTYKVVAAYTKHDTAKNSVGNIR
ncbi:MAG: hypothetical protein Q8S54_19905 [Bacteroidota bacterium]|uniref:hypothetical protein n=1 Tax=Phenylobacterium sp. TaxID=1871053 RepID=UPI001D79AD17|nr:hypothetical protein [Phenylobacterium sp.]MBA4408291.1 hypothetical protein [Odoribacter sp.]MDP3174089.1 hypothetical protein [Phenylobacterium sp.]MDP3645435.1 hypothetical protein [Bacteroidota bacterium]